MGPITQHKPKKEEIAQEALDIFYNKYPEFLNKYGEEGKKRSYEDLVYHLSYLESAISVNEPKLFIDYLAWCKMFFKSIKFPLEHIVESLEILVSIYEKNHSETSKDEIEYLNVGLDAFNELPSELNSFINADSKLGVLAQQYLNSLLRRDRETASKLIFDAVKNGVAIKDIYLHVFQNSQYEIGRLWQLNKINVAMEHYCTATTQLIISRLYPYIFKGIKGDSKMVATSVSGELHELGIRMISDFFEMEGWDTYYLGANVPDKSIISMMEEVNADILAISATIAFHIDKVKDLIDLVKENENLKNVKILVGGYPFNNNRELWKAVGADGFATDAESAVKKVKQLQMN